MSSPTSSSLQMRRQMIEKRESETTMRVRIHYDGMVIIFQHLRKKGL